MNKKVMTAEAFCLVVEHEIRQCIRLAEHYRSLGMDVTDFDEAIRLCAQEVIKQRATHDTSDLS